MPSVPIHDQPSDSSSFYLAELSRACSEQLFGVAGVGEITSSSPTDHGVGPFASVEIVLLDETKPLITVMLSLAGYKIISRSNETVVNTPMFETLDDLLKKESPAYAALWMGKLMERLSEAAPRFNTKDDSDD